MKKSGERVDAKDIKIEVWKDGSRFKLIECGDERRAAQWLYFSISNKASGARPVLIVDGRELSATEALRFLRTGRLADAVD